MVEGISRPCKHWLPGLVRSRTHCLNYLTRGVGRVYLNCLFWFKVVGKTRPYKHWLLGLAALKRLLRTGGDRKQPLGKLSQRLDS